MNVVPMDLRSRHAAPWVRVLLLLSSVALAAIVSREVTGSVVPPDPRDALLFQSALLLIVLGTSLVEYKFTKPADAAVNAIGGIVTLVGVYPIAPPLAWWCVFGYCVVVFLCALSCVAVSASSRIGGWQATVARVTYGPAVTFGRAQLLFSVLFLFGLFAFRSLQSPLTVLMVLYWGLFLVLWPLGIPRLLSSLAPRADTSARRIGTLLRTDWPNLVRVSVESNGGWDHDSPAILVYPDGTQALILPIYTQPTDSQVLGTALVLRGIEVSEAGLAPQCVYALREVIQPTGDEIAQALGGGPGSQLVGIVMEDSTIAAIRFEVWRSDACHEGMLVVVRSGSADVMYQVTNGQTRDESMLSGRHGLQVATAVQIGTRSEDVGFQKFPWLPLMNAPVFAYSADEEIGKKVSQSTDFTFGTLPGTSIAVRGDFIAALDHHTAILGVTGSGKTEYAFDLIRHSLASGVRVVCIDLTARYAPRLADLSPHNLTLSAETTKTLSALLFAAETGAYGAGEEKKALKMFSDPVRVDVRSSIDNFMSSEQGKSRLGIISLEEISNTKATLAITEIFLSCLLESAKNRSRASDRLLVVLEEAHTLVPEASTMGLGDYDSRGMVAKIAQIALQGRKYGVGLLVLAQRTATVSKTILTQCNTTISFGCIDETSLNFLRNVFGEEYAALLPNLRSLQAVVFGKAIRSERPLLIDIRFDGKKRVAADTADGRSLTDATDLVRLGPVRLEE